MKIKSAVLDCVCGITSRLPQHTIPEFAFAGKSNVGKSSLINALVNRKALARTSSQPGKTQTINYYRINDALYCVDLPGYGFARVSQSVREQWGEMIERYLHTSECLKAVFLLVDIRHEPSANDREMYRWILSQGFRPVVIATKADKIKRSQLPKQLKLMRSGLEADADTVLIPFSAQTRQGLDEVWNVMEGLLSEEAENEKESAEKL